MNLTRRQWLAGSVGAALGSTGLLAHAQAYPSRAVELLVPYPPGASVDLIGRIIQTRMGASLGQPVIIDNKGGAGGNVGASMVAKSPADGYRLLLSTNAITTINPHVVKGANFDAAKDLMAVAQICNGPMGIAVRADMPVKTVAELVDYAKKNPGKVSYGTPGSGSPHHVMGELINQRGGVSMLHVPYRGIGPALTDLLGGNINVVISTLAALAPQISAGKIRLLAIAEAQRFSAMPQVPTVAETFPGFEASSWFGIYAPTGTPREIVQRVHAAVNAALADAEVKKKLIDAYLDPAPATTEAFAQRTQADYARWGKFIKEKGITAD